MRHALICAAMICAATLAAAEERVARASAFIDAHVHDWAHHPILIDAMRTQNRAHADLTADEIQTMDQTWRAEKASGDYAMIADMLERPASAFLQDQVAAMGGDVTDVIVMDALGLNVAVSDVTTDIWQGDEAKFEQTFLRGSGHRHMAEVTYSQKRGVHVAWVSFTISDPDTGTPIGAMATALKAEVLCPASEPTWLGRLSGALRRTFSGKPTGFDCGF